MRSVIYLESKAHMSCSSQRIARHSYNQQIQYTRRARSVPTRSPSGRARRCNPRSATRGRTGRAREEQGRAATAAFRQAPAQPVTPAHGLSRTPQPLFHVSLASHRPLSNILNSPVQSASSIAVMAFDLPDRTLCLLSSTNPHKHPYSNLNQLISNYFRNGIMLS